MNSEAQEQQPQAEAVVTAARHPPPTDEEPQAKKPRTEEEPKPTDEEPQAKKPRAKKPKPNKLTLDVVHYRTGQTAKIVVSGGGNILQGFDDKNATCILDSREYVFTSAIPNARTLISQLYANFDELMDSSVGNLAQYLPITSAGMVGILDNTVPREALVPMFECSSTGPLFKNAVLAEFFNIYDSPSSCTVDAANQAEQLIMQLVDSEEPSARLVGECCVWLGKACKDKTMRDTLPPPLHDMLVARTQ